MGSLQIVSKQLRSVSRETIFSCSDMRDNHTRDNHTREHTRAVHARACEHFWVFGARKGKARVMGGTAQFNASLARCMTRASGEREGPLSMCEGALLEGLHT